MIRVICSAKNALNKKFTFDVKDIRGLFPDDPTYFLVKDIEYRLLCNTIKLEQISKD